MAFPRPGVRAAEDEASLHTISDVRLAHRTFFTHKGTFIAWRQRLAVNCYLETSKQAYEDLEEAMKRYGFSVKRPAHREI